MALSDDDLKDIQGLVRFAYTSHPYAAYVLLRFRPDGAAVRAWLRELLRAAPDAEIGAIDPATRSKPGGAAVNVAFTVEGLGALGLDTETIATFPPEFRQGMHGSEHRQRMLGDIDESHPRNWTWGYQDDRERLVHAVLILFARTADAREAACAHWVRRAGEIDALESCVMILRGELPDPPGSEVPREAFGFADGISDPVLTSFAPKASSRAERHVIADGEILLGHVDDSGYSPRSPSVAPHPAAEQAGLQSAADVAGERRFDLGRNGSFLVFRELHQNVEGFHQWCRSASARLEMDPDRFEALLVGRWHNGDPLVLTGADNTAAAPRGADQNDFAYRAADPRGEICPIGAHIRRANPRDSLGDDAEGGWQISNRHRIIRRGRPYVGNSGRKEGLHFICLNADIARQFEFVQRNWINEPTFGGLLGEDDPIVGSRVAYHAATPNGRAVQVDRMTLPPAAGAAVYRTASGLPRFVTMRGGAYFFLPSLRALRYLASDERTQPVAAWDDVPANAAEARAFGRWLTLIQLRRFPLLLAAMLAAFPAFAWFSAGGLRIIVEPLFITTRLGVTVIAALASLTATVAMIASRLVNLYAPLRFHLEVAPQTPLTWRFALAWQALSIPAVYTAVKLSAGDVGGGWAALRFALHALAGYAVALILLMGAEAVRAFFNRNDRRYEGVLVPVTALLARVQLQPLPCAFERMAAPIERRILALPPSVLAGYVEARDGRRRLLPGHLAALVLFGIVAALYVAAGWLWRPTNSLWPGMPPLAYGLFLLMAVGWFASGAAFFLDRWRVPLLMLGTVGVVLSASNTRTDHQFAVSGDVLRPAASPAEAVATADRKYGSPPVIVVAAGGGGIHQAAWTARVLAGLADIWGPTFTQSLRLVSAASAGSIGAVDFIHGLDDNSTLPDRMSDRIVEAAMGPASTEIWWGLTYPDVLRAFVPLVPSWLVRPTVDRGWALEQALARHMSTVKSGHPTLNAWSDDAREGRRPAIALNTTAVETGGRVVFATYRLEREAAALPEESRPPACEAAGGRDVPIITAARIAAAFPYVTPFPRAALPASCPHLADGGFWDNYGEYTAHEWLEEVFRTLPADRPVIFIRIPPAEPGPSHVKERATVWQTIAPAATLMSVRTNAQGKRNERDREALRASRPGMVIVTLGLDVRDRLAWHLSAKDRATIQKRWRALTARDAQGHFQSELSQIEAVLGQPDDRSGN